MTAKQNPAQDHPLTDTQLGALIRTALQRTGVDRVTVFGGRGKERIEAVRAERLHPNQRGRRK